MFKPTFSKIICYIFIKYLIYYVFFVVTRYDSSRSHGEVNFDSIIFAIMIMLPLPVANIIFFSAPLYYSFRINRICFILLALAVFVGEYFLFISLNSGVYSQISYLGIQNEIISIVTFVIFFYKYISVMSQNNKAVSNK
jgi:hypothetical protein